MCVFVDEYVCLLAVYEYSLVAVFTMCWFVYGRTCLMYMYWCIMLTVV